MSRWSALLALHWADNRKRYLLALPAMMGLLLVWYCFLTIMDRFDPLDEGMQQVTYISGLLVVGCLYASTIFAEFDSKAKAIAWLSVPASALEKLLCGLLFGVVVFFVVYNVVFYLVDIPMVRLTNELIARQHRVWPGGYSVGPSKIYNVFTGKGDDPMDQRYHLYLLSYLAIQAAFVLGSIYFTRYAFIKTAVALLLFVLFFTIFQSRIIERALPGGFRRGPFFDWIKGDGTLNVKIIRISPLIETALGFLLLYGIPPVFWITTYFRIKEKEV